MNIQNAKFETTAVNPRQYPAGNIPEIAFAGRSNVGKSSIINTLLNRKKLARVGNIPGKTRVINFFNVDDRLYFVDLPGYGYANVSKAEKTKWGNMIESYLNSRQQLKLIIMVVDIRHKPSENDKIMYEWLRAKNIPHILIASKADKISKGHIRERLLHIKSTLDIAEGISLIPFSSGTQYGRNEVWKEIDKFI